MSALTEFLGAILRHLHDAENINPIWGLDIKKGVHIFLFVFKFNVNVIFKTTQT